MARFFVAEVILSPSTMLRTGSAEGLLRMTPIIINVTDY